MLATTQNMINVGMAELAISQEPSDILTVLGLGSCIALCAYDPATRTAGLAHMVLPRCHIESDEMGLRVKYIETGVPWLLHKMFKLGVQKSNLILKITGGARMLNIPGNNNFLDIGQKNIVQVKQVLAREGLRTCAEDLGGGLGRSVRFYVETGKIQVKAVNGQIIDL
jgi:chemotaxis protein CheD